MWLKTGFILKID